MMVLSRYLLMGDTSWTIDTAFHTLRWTPSRWREWWSWTLLPSRILRWEQKYMLSLQNFSQNFPFELVLKWLLSVPVSFVMDVWSNHKCSSSHGWILLRPTDYLNKNVECNMTYTVFFSFAALFTSTTSLSSEYYHSLPVRQMDISSYCI